ncbi:hypothetical protein C8Q73DRAFT_311970 [Cubamyces lactineus]|nr:hypothetical protein C8Q73DRAFT_311970 [Cubamyces lactineus]
MSRLEMASLDLRDSRGSYDVDVSILGQDRKRALARGRGGDIEQSQDRARGRAMGLAEGICWDKRTRVRPCFKHERRRASDPRQQTVVKPNTCLTSPNTSRTSQTRSSKAKQSMFEHVSSTV